MDIKTYVSNELKRPSQYENGIEKKKIILFYGLMLLNDATVPSAEERRLHFMTHIEARQAELGDQLYATMKDLASGHADSFTHSCIALCQQIKADLLEFKREAVKNGLDITANAPAQEQSM